MAVSYMKDSRVDNKIRSQTPFVNTAYLLVGESSGCPLKNRGSKTLLVEHDVEKCTSFLQRGGAERFYQESKKGLLPSAWSLPSTASLHTSFHYATTFGYMYALITEIMSVTITRTPTSKGSWPSDPVTISARKPSTM